jgi:hypothetical protein
MTRELVVATALAIVNTGGAILLLVRNVHVKPATSCVIVRR